MSEGILIPRDEGQPLTSRDYGTLEDYQHAVGGYVEVVRTDWLGMAFFVHDEAKLIGLGLNRRATLLWWLTTPSARRRDLLAGDVVLVGRPTLSGATRDVPTAAHHLLFAPTLAVEVAVKGTTRWHREDEGFGDYFEAAHWALDLLSRRREVVDIRVVPT